MIQVSGMTYRIVHVNGDRYDAVRLLDDVHIGSFDGGPPLRLDCTTVSEALLRQVARAAIRGARTRWR